MGSDPAYLEGLRPDQAAAATGLVTEASRVRHRLLLAGEIAAIDDFAAWAKSRLPANAGLIDAREARPEFETAVERASRFLHLAALTTLLVAGAAIALASRRLVERQTDAVAIMRCLGAPRHLLTRVFALRLLIFGLLASLVGCGIGWLAQDLGPDGICGAAARADADRGARLLEHLVDKLAALARELAATPLTMLAPAPPQTSSRE